MAITLTKVAELSTTANQSLYDSSLWTPTANKPTYAFVVSYGGSLAPTSFNTTNGLTFTQEKTVSNGTRVCTMYRAAGVASPTNGKVTADFGGVNQSACFIIVIEGDGIDTTTTDGVVQSNSTSGSNTSGTVTLSAFGDAANATIAGWGHAANEVINLDASSGWAEFFDSGQNTPSSSGEAAWNAGNDTSVSFSWVSSVSYMGIAAELKATAGGGGGSPAAAPASRLTLLGVGI